MAAFGMFRCEVEIKIGIVSDCFLLTTNYPVIKP